MNVISHIALFLLSMSIMIGQSSLKQVKSGTMYEFIGKKKNVKIKIDAFLMSDHAVTNGEFRNFIRQNPQWKKSRVSRLLADRNYLQHWTSDSTFPAHMEHATITNVSWHSAKAYCAWKGGMLPTNALWEFALSKNHISIQTGKKISINEVLLKWYANGNSDIFKHGIISSDGIRDLVGSHWEWTEDFNELMVNGDSRGGGNQESNFVCGSASLNSNDASNYARFIRIAFRTSIKASTTTKNLGFRICHPKMEIAQ